MNIYEIYIVTAILCGAVAAWIAKGKGRSPILWFFIGAVLNVVAISAFWILSTRKKATAIPGRQ